MLRKALAILFLTLFSLGTFGVTIEQHLCCHSYSSENNTSKQCNDDESCCDNKEDCCDEISSTLKIAKDFTQQNKQTLEAESWVAIQPTFHNSEYYFATVAQPIASTNYTFYPPPTILYSLYCTFLI